MFYDSKIKMYNIILCAYACVYVIEDEIILNLIKCLTIMVHLRV